MSTDEWRFYTDRCHFGARVSRPAVFCGRRINLHTRNRTHLPELGIRLASPEGGRGNHRNGRSGKTVLTDGGRCGLTCPATGPAASSHS